MPAGALYLIDGSAYVYRAFFALPPLTSPGGVPTNAVYGFATMLLKLLKDAQPQLLAIVFDAPGATFRDSLYEQYKGNRPAAPAELEPQWPLVYRVAEAFRVPTLTVPGVEADDVIGTLARRCAEENIDCVVITSDKDLMQIVGPHVRLWDTMRDRWTDTAAVQERFGVEPKKIVEIMGLMGDTVDNIPGVKGIGEKSAAALIRHFGSIEAVLNNLDAVAELKLRGAKQVAERLREHAAEARLSRQLAQIRCDVPLDVAPAALRFAGPDPDAAHALFTELGFRSLARDLPAPPPPAPQRLETAADVQALARQWRRVPAVALACVASGPPMSAPCQGIIVTGTRADELYFVPPRTDLLAALEAALRRPGFEKVGHDLKADLICLSRFAITLPGPLFDTMVAAGVLGASTTPRLPELSANLLGHAIDTFREGQVQPATVAAGVQQLLRLRELLGERLRDDPAERLFLEVEMPLVEVLANMERRGVRLDTAALRQMGAEWQRSLESLRADIHRLAGGEFNIHSPAQLRKVLFERLRLPQKGVRRGKTGLSTDVDVLTRLAADHPLPAKILEYRAISKLISTYVDTLLAAVDPQTKRLHTVFHQAVVATGRLSSSDPNLQNIPVRGAEGRRIRSAFIPADGAVLLAADYSQIELRVMAHLAEDPVLLAAFANGEDIHRRTAAEVFDCLPLAVTPEMRRVAKIINFGIMYGMGAARLAGELGISTPAARRYIGHYFERYQGVRAFIERTIASGKKNGYVTTLFGRRRPLPELRSPDRATAQAAERAAINAPIQGTAADLIKIAMVRIDRRLRREGLGATMILQVHDELLFEVPVAEVAPATAVVRDEMEHVASLRVPLIVDMGCGRNWAEAH